MSLEKICDWNKNEKWSVNFLKWNRHVWHWNHSMIIQWSFTHCSGKPENVKTIQTPFLGKLYFPSPVQAGKVCTNIDRSMGFCFSQRCRNIGATLVYLCVQDTDRSNPAWDSQHLFQWFPSDSQWPNFAAVDSVLLLKLHRRAMICHENGNEQLSWDKCKEKTSAFLSSRQSR